MWELTSPEHQDDWVVEFTIQWNPNKFQSVLRTGMCLYASFAARGSDPLPDSFNVAAAEVDGSFEFIPLGLQFVS